MDFQIDESTMIPLEPGQAVKTGWGETPPGRAAGVTMHWAVTTTVANCTKIIGGTNAIRKGEASAHYCIGRSFEEGTARYVAPENRSFHCQVGQTLRWDGQPMEQKRFSGINTTIGIETAHLGFPTAEEMAAGQFVVAAAANGVPMDVQLWTDEQIDMIITIGKEIVERFPDIGPRDWHGHHDLAPKRKIDVAGFPFARVLRGVYSDNSISDVWTHTLGCDGASEGSHCARQAPRTVRRRQRFWRGEQKGTQGTSAREQYGRQRVLVYVHLLDNPRHAAGKRIDDRRSGRLMTVGPAGSNGAGLAEQGADCGQRPVHRRRRHGRSPEHPEITAADRLVASAPGGIKIYRLIYRLANRRLRLRAAHCPDRRGV